MGLTIGCRLDCVRVMSTAEPGNLSNSPSSFDQLVAAVADYAIFTLDGDGHIRDWNLGAERIKGYSAEEVIGRHFGLFYLEEERADEVPERELETAIREGRCYSEGWRLRKDGTRFWANATITAVRDVCGKMSFLKITRDITERKLAIESLRQSEERFRLLVERVEEYAIFMLDPEGHIMSWNRGAKRLKGYDEAEILGQHFSVFYPLETRATEPHEMIRRAVSDGEAETEGWRLRKDGTRFWGNVVITAVHDDSGELRGFAKVTRDLTARREVELLQQADRRKNDFLATLAHELRNPLAPIHVGVEVLLTARDNPDAVAQVAPMLRRQVDQMSRLIDDLLDMSRVSQGKITLRKSRVTIVQIFENAVETVAPAIREFGHELVVRLPEGTVEIDADPQRIAQVISNLLSNAVKFTPPGGRILLEAETELADSVLISVSDNGRGIPLESQTRVFELFEQVADGADGGLGIGLTLVKRLTEMHGGRVSLKSGGLGCGSEFRLHLPAIPVAVASTSAGAARIRPRKLTRVLIADDGKNAADILAMFFRLEGLETAVAYDGGRAVELAKSFVPDLVCLDLGMPVLDGYDAARQIRALHPAAFIVALSGWSGDDDRQRSAAAGFDAHLVKPVQPADLRELMAKYLGG